MRLGFEPQIGVDCQMGDDAVELYYPGLCDAYQSLGFRTKGVVMMDGKFTFCSTVWSDDWRGSPENALKTLFRYVSKDVDSHSRELYRNQLMWDLRHWEQLHSWDVKLREQGV